MKENPVTYKWKKLFAAINYNEGQIVLTPEYAQELIDDIDNIVGIYEKNLKKIQEIILEK